MFGKPAAPTTGGFGFGTPSGANTTPANAFGGSGTTGTFGGAMTNTPNTGLFGAASTPNQPAASNKPPSLSIMGANTTSAPTTGQLGAGMFGLQQPAQNATQTNPGFGTGGLFGGGASTQSGGAQQQQQQQQQSQPQQTSLFGTNQPTQPAQTGGLFGAKPATTGGGLFGGTTGTNAGTSLFGQSNATFGGGGGLVGGASLFGTQMQQPQQQPFQMQPPPAPQAIDHVKNIAACWDPKNPACHFKFYFYNLVHPSEVHLYQPAPGEDRSLYEQAKADNPEPSCMVPVLAVGFDGLKTRLEMQDEQLKIHREKIQEFKERLEKVEQTHTIETVIKIERYRNKQRQIAHKVLQLMKSVQILRNKGYSLRAEEESLMTRLSSMERDLAKPSVFRGRINEIHAQVQQLKDANRLVLGSYGGVSGDEGFVLADPQALQPVIQTLEWMSRGLGELTNVVKEDDDALNAIEKGYALAN